MKTYYKAMLPTLLIVIVLIFLPDFSFKIPFGFLAVLAGLGHYYLTLKKERWHASKTRSQRHQD